MHTVRASIASERLFRLPLCRRAFYDKRVSQEVDGEALGEVRVAAGGVSSAPATWQ